MALRAGFRWGALWGAIAAILFMLAASVAADRASAAVLLVCNTPSAPAPCPASGFHTIQGAVDAAAPGDWVLVWPGVYHEKGNPKAGVMITKPNIHLRGMDRNGVVVDGTNPGSLDACPTDAQHQDLNGGNGRNGIEVLKADGTYVENLTVCNYLSGNGQGNEIWWNGGDGSGTLGMGSYWGNYLTATSTYFKDASSAMGMYGLFTSNAQGPGAMTHTYASNMGDSAYYIGACQQLCHQTIDDGHAEHSALGYSGTNAGGALVLKNSEWNDNKSGIVPNSLNNDDAPPPQDGRCPGSATQSCMVISGNHVHDNNNPNVPGSGIASSAPVGTGIEISGGQFDTITGNTVDHNNAWGIVTHDYPDTETPPPASTCQGGTASGPVCLFHAQGNVIQGNTLSANGSFGNPTNGDLANEPGFSNPRNCFSGNTDPNGLTSDPPMIESVDGPPCDQPGSGDNGVLAAELVCDAAIVGTCGVPGANYPTTTAVTIKPVQPQATMPNPCDGVPANPWCATSHPVPSSQAIYPLGAIPANLGLPGSHACVDRRRFAFRLRHPLRDRITSVVAYVNGRRAARRHGHSVSSIAIRALPQGTFVVRVVAQTSSGRVVESVRRYHACTKTRPHTTVHSHRSTRR